MLTVHWAERNLCWLRVMAAGFDIPQTLLPHKDYSILWRLTEEIKSTKNYIDVTISALRKSNWFHPQLKLISPLSTMIPPQKTFKAGTPRIDSMYPSLSPLYYYFWEIFMYLLCFLTFPDLTLVPCAYRAPNAASRRTK